MERVCINSSLPDYYASIDDTLYILTRFRTSVSRDNHYDKATGVTTSGTYIDGEITVFGKSRIPHQNSVKPMPVKLEVYHLPSNSRFVASNVIFTGFTAIPGYDNIAVGVEWMAQDIERLNIIAAK